MCNGGSTLNDKAWEALFLELDILKKLEVQGNFVISALEIKKHREPRLMVKFDHIINLPPIFRDNGLVILPISRGHYIISHFDAYHCFEHLEESITKFSLPSILQSLDPDHIPSEAIAINCALASGILEDFLGEEILYSTVSGRMSSNLFNFEIFNTRCKSLIPVQVDNSQIEIDAAVEGIETLALIEAKRDLSSDFLIRQIYYPFRLWHTKVSKKVKPIFLVYSNGIFKLYEYEFQTPNQYNSLVLVKHKNYSIEDTEIDITDLFEIHKQVVNFVNEPEISFPQADSFERVINLCELLENQELSREQVTEQYAFDIRQTNYYTDAARYLGLIDKWYEDGRKPFYRLSDFGRKVMKLNYKQRQLAFCRCILEHKVFSDAFACCQNGYLPQRDTIIQLMHHSQLYNIHSDSTYGRRASTIIGWLNWMLGLVNN